MAGITGNIGRGGLIWIVTLLIWLGGIGPARAQGGDDLAAVLAEFGIRVGTGVAAGFVPDSTCSACHIDAARGFGETGMARSFYRPSADNVIEDFSDTPYYHAPSDRYYRISLQDGDYRFRRYRLGADGEVFDDWSIKIDWIMGSGNTSRVYLYQTEDGALFQLPLAWYSQARRWAMAPGFEFKGHSGINRQVRYRCMFCHNAIADLPAGSDAYGMPEVFPAELPQGIGCQRCHGPGAKHVGLALSGSTNFDQILSSVVNPAKLPTELANSLCYACHMQPTVAVASPLRLGRNVFDFRPGQDLTYYLARIDITDANRTVSERFDINHSAYRLQQSRSFIESNGALGCLSCHNPHRKIKPEERAANYRKVCLVCHLADADGQPRMAKAGSQHPAIGPAADCTLCHMPKRRTQDVIEVTMTDHLISRFPPPGNLLAPMAKLPADVTELHLVDPDLDVAEDEGWVYKTMAALEYANYDFEEAKDALETVLGRGDYPYAAPWLRLSKAQFGAADFGGAARAARRALSFAPDNPGAHELLALSAFAAGNRAGGIAMAQERLDGPGDLADLQLSLGEMYLAVGDVAAAKSRAETAVALRHNNATAWTLLGDVALAEEDANAAAAAYLQALAINPANADLRRKLIAVLEAAGETAAAARHRAALAE